MRAVWYEQTGAAPDSNGSAPGSGDDADATLSTDIPLQTLAGSALVNVLA